MIELELSIMTPAESKEIDPISVLQRMLKDFEAKKHIRVRLNTLPWATGWAELVKGALYGHGPDVSEVGNTWMSGFIGMNALMALTEQDAEVIGGPSVILPQAWQSCILAGDKQIWAIPWLSGTRVLFYRRDMLAKAGIDEKTAYSTHQQMIQTFERLQSKTNMVPWVVPTNITNYTLHNIASWVWNAKGDFVSPDGKQLLFMRDEASAGMHQYYELGRFLPKPGRKMDEMMTADLFWQKGKAATIMFGSWSYFAYESSAAREVIDNLGVALAPGIPFVGGSNMVVWKHTRHKEAALELLHFLTSPEVQILFSQSTGLLPVNTNVLADPRFSEGPLYPVVKHGLEIGRPYPMTQLWGLLEDRLTTALGQIWSDVLSEEQPDFETIIRRHMEPVANSLSFALRSSMETQRRVRELQLLQEVGQAAASGLRLDDTLRGAAQSLSKQLDGAPIAILLIDSMSGKLHLKASAGYPPDKIINLDFQPDSALLSGVSKNLAVSIQLDESRESGSTILRVPLITGAKVIGVLIMESSQFNEFTDDDKYLLSTLANNLTVLIERARLFEEVEVAQAELEQKADKLARSNTQLEQFAYVASHDLQEPLRKVQAFSNRLQVNFSPVLGEQGNDYLNRIQASANRMQAMVHDLLNLSRVTTEAKPFVMTDLKQIAEEVVSDLEYLIEKTNGQVEIGDLFSIEADPVQMRQLLGNLIVNSLKFNRKGIPPVIKVWSLIKQEDAAWYDLYVEDNGIGFEEKYTEKIFQPFQRLHSRDEYEGNGMGLAICQKIADRHGGSITVKSKPGKGSVFITHLPAKNCDSAIPDK